MNMPHSLIWELLLSKFKLSHNVAEEPKNICCVKDEGAVDQRTVILDVAVCISHNVNTLGKCIHPTILPPAIDK